MSEEELIEFLKRNLSVWVDTYTDFGPVECLKIEVCLGDITICESSCSLPDKG